MDELIKALKDGFVNAHVTVIGGWLVWDGEHEKWEVRKYGSNSKEPMTLTLTDDLSEAVRVLVNESEKSK